MRVLTFDELTPEMELDRALLHTTAFGGTFSRPAVEIYRRRTSAFSDYVGVFAVEEGHVVGQILVLRLPYAFREGPGTITGIAGVATRPDRAHRGVSKRLLTEVHQREREDGIHYAGLWTNRSWIAHGFYERFGYRDVHMPPWAVHAPAKLARRPPRGMTVRPGRVADLDALDELREDRTRDRVGFYGRPKGSGRAAALAGDFHPAKNLLVVQEGREIAGYAHVDVSPTRVICGELVGRTPRVERALRDAVSNARPHAPYFFQHTLVSDAPDVFRSPQYTVLSTGWYGFLGAKLGAGWTRRAAVAEFATADPRFVCLAGDRF